MPTRRLSSVPYVMALLAILWLTSQIQRFSLATYVGASSMMPDLGITAAGAGFLAAVYFPVYGLMQIPSGILADQGEPRRNLVVGASLMSVSGLAFAVAPTFGTAVVARIAVGLSAGFLWLSIVKICWLLPGGGYAQRLGFVIGIGSIGGILGLGVLPALLALVDWRSAAGIVAVTTLVAALLIARASVRPSRQATSVSELRRRSTIALKSVPSILGRLEYWPVFLPNMLWMGSQFAVLTWLPRYARDVLEMPPAAVGLLPALVPMGQVVGNFAMGWVTGRAPRLGIPIFLSTAFAYALALATLPSGAAVAIGGFSVFVVAVVLGVLYGSFFISVAWIGQNAEPENLGIATGVLNGLGFLPAFILPWAMGHAMDLVDRPTSPAWQYSSGAYDVAFTVVLVVMVVGLVGSGLIRLRLRRRGAKCLGEMAVVSANR